MKVRFLCSVVGLDLAWAPGQVVDLPDAEAEKWADGVRAVRVEEPAPPPPVAPPPPAEPAAPVPPPAAGEAQPAPAGAKPRRKNAKRS